MMRKSKLSIPNTFERLTHRLNFIFIQAWEQAIEQEKETIEIFTK